MLSVTEINTFNDLLELRRDWNKILAKSRDNNIYLTWEYTSTFWKHFGKGKKLRILCLADKTGIIAIAPLRQSRYSYAGLLSYNVIEPLAYRGLNPEGADYTGLLIAEREIECLKKFFNYLVKDNSWDFVYLLDFSEISTLMSSLPKMPQKIQQKLAIEKGALCPYTPLPNSIDEFFKQLSPKFRKNLRRSMKKLQDNFGKVELKKYDEIGSVEESMSIFFKLHQKRCNSKQLPGVFATPEVCNFYVEVAKLFAEKGWLALYFLTLNDEPIAAQYSFKYANKLYYALGGFDPQYSDYSIGNLLCLKMLQKSIEENLTEFDFLKGDEKYKFNWTAKYRTNMGIKFANQKLSSRFYDWGIRIMKRTKISKFLQHIVASN